MLFDAKVSKTVNTVLVLLGWLPGARKHSPLLATCRSIQHARRLCVEVAPSVLCILQGLLSHPSSTVPFPLRGFYFFASCTWCLSVMHPFVADWGCIRGRIIPKPFSVSRKLSIAQYVRTMDARLAKRVISRRLTAFKIPLSVQLLQKIEITFSSRQSLSCP